jgi:autotransporter-associated beta strand protein
LSITGVGITNNSGIVQSFLVPDDLANINFSNNARAGTQTFFRVAGGGPPGFMIFDNSSTADHGTFDVVGGAGPALIQFQGNSTADHGTFTAEGPFESYIYFFGNSTAADATLTAKGGTGFGPFNAPELSGIIDFGGASTAGSATLIATGGSDGGKGGQIFLGSDGGTARVEVFAGSTVNKIFGDGYLDISFHSAPGATIGSLEGSGNVFLGGNNLTVGSNNLSTTFSGVIQDGSPNTGGAPGVGSLTKIGSGALTLAGANTYTGDTNVNGGLLQIDGSIASNTFIDDGTLAGSGTVNGAVTNNDSGTISPGDALGVPGVLTIGSNYTQVPTATLVIQIGGPDARQVSVLDVRGSANLNGYLEPVFVNGFVPRIGQSFTIINYASHTGFFSHIQNQVFDHGRKRWLLVSLRTSARLIAIGNGR